MTGTSLGSPTSPTLSLDEDQSFQRLGVDEDILQYQMERQSNFELEDVTILAGDKLTTHLKAANEKLCVEEARYKKVCEIYDQRIHATRICCTLDKADQL